MAAENRWTDSAERDLIMSVVLNDSEDVKIKPNWNKIHERMVSWGYRFTKDAINQRWSKNILKDFKTRHSSDISPLKRAGESAAITPRKRTKTTKSTKGKEGFAGPSGRGGGVDVFAPAGAQDDEGSDSDGYAGGKKKAGAAQSAVKNEGGTAGSAALDLTEDDTEYEDARAFVKSEAVALGDDEDDRSGNTYI